MPPPQAIKSGPPLRPLYELAPWSAEVIHGLRSIPMAVHVDTLLSLFRSMWTVRALEQGLEREFQKGNVPGMLHTGLGQGAIQAGPPAHRCHGVNALAQERHKGNGRPIMAELFG